jgi:hypothetical protein
MYGGPFALLFDASARKQMSARNENFTQRARLNKFSLSQTRVTWMLLLIFVKYCKSGCISMQVV